MSTYIEWTDETWNPVTGCTKVSSGCLHCYAERMAHRLQAMGNKRYRDGFAVTLQPNLLEKPMSWRKPRMIFVCFMGDLLHPEIPLAYLKQVLDVMRATPRHTFQVLTKRAYRLKCLHSLQWPDNAWVGTSVESLRCWSRIGYLRQVRAKTKFLSLEPLLGPMPRLNLDDIDWVIVGGESGPDARPMRPDWARDIRDQCVRAEVPFFFKQWGGVNKKKAGRWLDGRFWDEMPRGVTR